MVVFASADLVDQIEDQLSAIVQVTKGVYRATASDDLSLLRAFWRPPYNQCAFSQRIRPEVAFFDMDATLIEEESLVSMAEFCGQSKAVEMITNAAMAGQIDFREALAQRLALVRGLTLADMESVAATLKVRAGAADLIRWFRERGTKTYICTGGFSHLARPLVESLGMDGFVANDMEFIDGVFSGKLLNSVVDAPAKAEFVKTTLQRLSLEAAQAIAFGDGANDRLMMEQVTHRIGIIAKPSLMPYLNGYVGSGDFGFVLAALNHLDANP
jgi:phosphoserine phosphatase